MSNKNIAEETSKLMNTLVDAGQQICASIEQLRKTDITVFSNALKAIDSAKTMLNNGIGETDNLIDVTQAVNEAERLAREAMFEISKEPIRTDRGRINILHLSDLHFSAPGMTYAGGDQVRKQQDKKDRDKRIKDALIKCLKLKSTPRINVIVITGDITYRGKDEGYENFVEWIKEICIALDLNVEDIILCPGNHDSRYVNETKKRKDYSIFEPKSTKKPENRRYEVVFSLDHIEERAKSQFDGYSNACSQLGLAGLSNYTKGRVLYLFGTRKHKDSGFIFVVLNSAWNSFPHRISGNGYDQGALFLSDIIVDDVMDTLESRNDEIVITLLHHPVSFMHPIELTAYDSDHPQSVVDRVVSFSDIILNGHIHGMIKPPDTLENKTLNFKGGTLHDNDQSPLRQFEILSINKHDRSCMQYVGSLHGMTWTVKPLGMEYYFGVGKRVQELSARIGQGLITPDQVIAGEFTSIPVELSEEIDELTRWVFSRLFYLNNKCSDIERLSDKALEYYYGRGVQARTIQKLLKMTPPKRKGDE